MRWLAMGVVLVALGACSPDGGSPVSPDVAPAYAKGGSNGGGKGGGGGRGGGGGGKVTYALTVDGSGPVRGDGAGAYVDGQDHVDVGPGGAFGFETFDDRGRGPATRALCVDFSSPAQVYSAADLNELAADAGSGWPTDVCADVTVHTRWADMGSMAVGSAVADGGKIAYNSIGNGSGWEWRLLFDTRDEAGHNTGPGVCIERTGATSWTITAGSGACGAGADDVLTLWHNVGGVFVHVADYVMPFTWVLEGA